MAQLFSQKIKMLIAYQWKMTSLMSRHILPSIFFNIQMTQKTKIQLLGYSGLIPFVSLPFFDLLEVGNNQTIFNLFVLYSLCIYVFLTGSFWAMSIQQGKEPIYAILLFFLPFLLGVFANSYANAEFSVLLSLILSYFVAFFYERIAFEQDIFYKQMRFRLTNIVIISHIGMLIIN